MGDFYHIFNICGKLHVRSCITIWANLLKGLWTYVGLNLVRAFYPQILSTP